MEGKVCKDCVYYSNCGDPERKEECKGKLTNEEQLLNEWQERLGLQDWAIALRVNVPQQLMDNSIGLTEWVAELKCATIKIVNPDELDKRILNYDFEKTLVHELLHIKFSTIYTDAISYERGVVDLVQHTMIDDLARALVMAKRGETKRSLAKDCSRIINYKELS